jgi:hypothetical protein
MWLFVGRIDKPARKMEVLEFAVKFCLTSAHETERQSSLRWLVLCRLLRYFYFPLTSPFAFHPSLLRWRKCCRSKSKRTMNQAVMSIDSFFFTFRKCRWGGEMQDRCGIYISVLHGKRTLFCPTDMTSSRLIGRLVQPSNHKMTEEMKDSLILPND